MSLLGPGPGLSRRRAPPPSATAARAARNIPGRAATHSHVAAGSAIGEWSCGSPAEESPAPSTPIKEHKQTPQTPPSLMSSAFTDAAPSPLSSPGSTASANPGRPLRSRKLDAVLRQRQRSLQFLADEQGTLDVRLGRAEASLADRRAAAEESLRSIRSSAASFRSRLQRVAEAEARLVDNDRRCGEEASRWRHEIVEAQKEVDKATETARSAATEFLKRRQELGEARHILIVNEQRAEQVAQDATALARQQCELEIREIALRSAEHAWEDDLAAVYEGGFEELCRCAADRVASALLHNETYLERIKELAHAEAEARSRGSPDSDPSLGSGGMSGPGRPAVQTPERISHPAQAMGLAEETHEEASPQRDLGSLKTAALHIEGPPARPPSFGSGSPHGSEASMEKLSTALDENQQWEATCSLNSGRSAEVSFEAPQESGVIVSTRSAAPSSSASNAPRPSAPSTPGLLLPSTSWLVGGAPNSERSPSERGKRVPVETVPPAVLQKALAAELDTGMTTPRSVSPVSCKSAPSPRHVDVEQVPPPASPKPQIVWSSPVRGTGTASGSTVNAHGSLTPPPNSSANARSPPSRTIGHKLEGSPQAFPRVGGALSYSPETQCYREAPTAARGQALLSGKQQRSPRALGGGPGGSVQQVLTARGPTLQRSSPSQPQMLSLQRAGLGVASSPSLFRVVQSGQTHFSPNQRGKR